MRLFGNNEPVSTPPPYIDFMYDARGWWAIFGDTPPKPLVGWALIDGEIRGLVVEEGEVCIADEIDDFNTFKNANQFAEADWRAIGR